MDVECYEPMKKKETTPKSIVEAPLPQKPDAIKIKRTSIKQLFSYRCCCCSCCELWLLPTSSV